MKTIWALLLLLVLAASLPLRLNSSRAQESVGIATGSALPGTSPDKPFFFVPGNAPARVRTFGFSTATFALTASGVALAIEAGNSGAFVKIKKLCVGPGVATAAAGGILQFARTITASSAATVVTPTAFSPQIGSVGGGGFSGTIRSANGATAVTGGTASANTVFGIPIHIGQAGASTGQTTNCVNLDDGTYQGLSIPPGATNGISFTFPGTAGGAGQSLSGIITEEWPSM